MTSIDPHVLDTVYQIALIVAGGLATAAVLAIWKSGRLTDRTERWLAKWFPWIGGAGAALLIWANVGSAALTLRGLTSGSGLLTGDDADLFGRVGGISACQHQPPQSDARAELLCHDGSGNEINLYLFRGATEMSAWFEKLTYVLSSDQPCEAGGRGTWSFSDGSVAGQVACGLHEGHANLWWTTTGNSLGGHVEIASGDLAQARAVLHGITFALAGETSPGCPPSDQVAWDGDGIGHDAWPSDELHLARVAPCTTVMLSTAGFATSGGASCAPADRKVCVLVFYATHPTALDATGLVAPGTWWGFTATTPKAAIADKSDLFNPRGWFGSRNCTTGSGCDSAEVWIVNDGAVTRVVVPHP